MNIDLRVVVFLLSLAAVVFAILLGAAVGSGEILYPSLAAAGFAAVFLISSPSVAALGAIATFSSGVTLPGLPGQMKLFDAFAATLLGLFLLQFAMKRGKSIPLTRLDWILMAFCGWIFFIGSVRGFGFLAFGGDMIGGFYYLRLFLAASLVITLPRVGLPPGSWWITLLLVGLLAPATLFADLLIVKGLDPGFVRIFVQTSGEIGDMVQSGLEGSDGSVARLWSAGPAANGMLLSLLCLVPMRRFFQFTGVQWLALFGGIIMLSLMSGFRLMTASLVIIAALTLYLQKGFTAPRLLALSLAASVGLMAVYTFAPEFPNSVQRSISWLPGIEVSNVVRGDANQTIEWRLRLWQEALRYLPDYWFIGKGFSYNKIEFISGMQSMYIDELRWAIVSGAYHNGWLSMILCTGVIGMVMCIIILIGPARKHWKRQRQQPWRSALLKRFHGVFVAALVANSAIFFIFYGDVHATFPGIFFFWAVLETISQADKEVASTDGEASDETGEESDSLYQES